MPRGGIRLCSLLWPATGGPRCWGFHWAVFEGGRGESVAAFRVGWHEVVQEQSPPSLSVPPLSQSYIQSFRERQTGPSLNSLIASSHAVVDLDYDCSSTVPLTTGSGPAVRV